MESLTTKAFIPRATENEAEPNEDAKAGYISAPPSVGLEQPPTTRRISPQMPNTNTMRVDFASLERMDNLATGDPTRCQRCLAYFNKYSSMCYPTKTWVCEFCSFPNLIEIDPDELPTEDIITYVDPNQDESKANERMAASVTGDVSVIFCIDISGSMSTSLPYTGPRHPYISGVSHISRLECVKVAVAEQLQKLVAETPNMRVGFVLFGADVTIIGDNSVSDHVVTTSLDDYEGLLVEGQRLGERYLSKPLKETLPSLLEKLEHIETGSSTALGPGLVVSVGLICAKGHPGSKVILCTDGEANCGIGQVESHLMTELAHRDRTYDKIGDFALEKGVLISLVSIADSECRLDVLSPCSMKTGGNIVKINPQNLSSDFSAFLSEQVIGFDVTIAVKLHRSMRFIELSPADQGPEPTVLVRKLGNVTAATFFSFDYAVKPQADLERAHIVVERLKKVPFQALLHYVAKDRVRYCKVITKSLDVTQNIAEAARDVNYALLTAHSLKKSAALAMEGRAQAAVGVTQTYRRLVQGNPVEEEKYNQQVQYLERAVQNEGQTVAFHRGQRSDHLIATVNQTQKFIPQNRPKPPPAPPPPS